MPENIIVRPEFSGILREQQSYAVDTDPRMGSTERMGNQINGWFDRLMIQSGADVPPFAILFLCILSGIALAGLAFVIQENPFSSGIAFLIGLILPVMILLAVRMQRQTKMMNQMPGMIDELARAAKTGRSLEHCLDTVAADTPAPLGTELQVCTRKIGLGLPLESALDDLPYRTGLVSASVLSTALGVHRQTGGDLIKVLERLAETVRDRIQYQGRLRAATAASRYVALLMLALPPAILLFFMFRDPNYFNNLMASSWGRGATFLALLFDVLGSLWILRILQQSQRT